MDEFEDYVFPADVDEVRFRAALAAMVDQVADEDDRVRIVAALERADSTVHEFSDERGDWLGVKISGVQFARIHRSRVQKVAAN